MHEVVSVHGGLTGVAKQTAKPSSNGGNSESAGKGDRNDSEAATGRNCFMGKSNANNHVQMIKSPSDTTIYAPALKRNGIGIVNRDIGMAEKGGMIRVGDMKFSGHVLKQGLDQHESVIMQVALSEGNGNQIDKTVEHFVEAVQIEHENRENCELVMDRERRHASQQGDSGFQQAKDHADRALIEAEKFEATVAQPNGMYNLGDNNQVIRQVIEHPGNMDNIDGLQSVIPNIGSGVSDDDFFHLTCHIEPSLIHKIENGEFVELEKLLPKDKFHRNEENRLEWMQRQGRTLLVPA